jgi:integrin beta 3
MLLEVPETFGRDIAAIIDRAVVPLLKRVEALEARPSPLRGEKGEPGDRGETGDVGPQGSNADVAPFLAPLFARVEALELRPIAEKGDAGERGEKGEPGLKGERGEKGEPGFVGRDGLPGLPGRDGKDGVGKDGAQGLDGKDGADGLGFDDFSFELADDGCTVIERLSRGNVIKEVRFRVRGRYRGPWKDGDGYGLDDTVSQGGSGWVALVDSPKGKPGDGSGEWQLFVKKGRDGRDGERGPQGPAGASGNNGRDLTQLGPDGSKW